MKLPWSQARLETDVLALIGERLGRDDLASGSALRLEPAVAYELALALEETFDVELSPADVSRAERAADWVRMVRGGMKVPTSLRPALLDTSPDDAWLQALAGDEAPTSERISVF